MSPLSADPVKRAKQLANLRPTPYPAAPVGNARRREHGAYGVIARQELEEKVRDVFDALSADTPVREVDGGLPAADAPAVRMLAEVLCRLDRIAEYLMRRGWQDDDGLPRPVLDYEARLRSHSLDLLKELGMTPRSRAALGLDLARAQRSTLQDFIDGDASTVDGGAR